MAGKSKAAASGRWRRRRTQDTMAKPTAQHARQQLAGGPRTRPLNKLKVHHSLQPPPPPSSRHRCRSRRRPPRQIPATRAVSRVAEPRRTSSSISTISTSSSSSSSSTRERRAPAALTQPAIRLPCAIDARRPPRRAPRSLLDDQRSPVQDDVQQCSMRRPQKRSQSGAQHRARHAADDRASAVRVGGEPRRQPSLERAAPLRARSSRRGRDEPRRRPQHL